MNDDEAQKFKEILKAAASVPKSGKCSKCGADVSELDSEPVREAITGFATELPGLGEAVAELAVGRVCLMCLYTWLKEMQEKGPMTVLMEQAVAKLEGALFEWYEWTGPAT